MPLKLKLDENGKVVVKDDMPVYIHDNGEEHPFDANQAMSKITQLGSEAKNHRIAKEAAEAKYKPFEGMEPEDVRKALETVDSLGKKKLIDAGEVERVKTEIIAATEAKYKPVVEENEKLKGALDNEIIGGAFSRSTFIKDKVAVPPPMLRATFGKNFKVEEGKLVAYDGAGNKMISSVKMGEPAEFEEAIERMIASDPYRDDILRGKGHTGSGASGDRGGGAGNGQGGKQFTRQQFDAMPPGDRAKVMNEGASVIDPA